MPPSPSPEQAIAVNAKPVGTVSVIVVAVVGTFRFFVAPVTPTPLETVVTVWLVQPFVPVKVKLEPPPLPMLTALSVNVGLRLLKIWQVIN